MAQKVKKTLAAVYHGEQGIAGTGVAAALKKLGIAYTMVNADEIFSGKLNSFKTVIFPGGGSIQIGKQGDQAVLEYLKKGGGFVGICAGCQYGIRLSLLDINWRPLRAGGVFDMRIIAKHPVTAGYEIAGRYPRNKTWKYSNKGRARIRYGNGGLLEPGSNVKTIVSYDEYGELAAIVSGSYGKGKVVLIAPHPESTPPVSEKKYGDSDQSQDPLKLFANSVKYTMKKTVKE